MKSNTFEISQKDLLRIGIESIRGNLSIPPSARFTLEKKDARTADVTFSKPLKGNTVYVFRLPKNMVAEGYARAEAERSIRFLIRVMGPQPA